MTTRRLYRVEVERTYRETIFVAAATRELAKADALELFDLQCVDEVETDADWPAEVKALPEDAAYWTGGPDGGWESEWKADA